MTRITSWYRGNEIPRKHVIECVGPGWHDIVNRLIDDLFLLGWDGDFAQCKEKFGRLRFYIGAGSDEVFRRIADAEAESAKTCEECGQPGRLYDWGWMKTLCSEHAKGRPDADSLS